MTTALEYARAQLSASALSSWKECEFTLLGAYGAFLDDDQKAALKTALEQCEQSLDAMKATYKTALEGAGFLQQFEQDLATLQSEQFSKTLDLVTGANVAKAEHSRYYW
jgi:hypothetical protein